jgi:A/G-specific adenine glycosylase
LSAAVSRPPARRGRTHPSPPADDTATSLSERVVAWQRTQGRHGLPWQREHDPYRVWLSEIMLQQTQVSTVLSYYARFLERFPDVATLARAPLDDVLAAWAGLGYYSRARNLHRCAQAVMAEHGGRFPASAEQLATLPGIGRSTAAAIAAFCFGERAAILDGNVKRVLTRVLGFGADLAIARHERDLWARACELLPPASADMPAYTQGLMDLGATVCLARKPNCLLCPLQGDCVAQREDRPEAYPVKTRKLKRTSREHWWLWLEHAGAVWLQRRPATGVWAGLWSLPLLDDEAALDAVMQRWPVPVEPQPVIEHALTHFDWTLHPWRAVLESPEGVEAALGPGRWVALDALDAVGLPAPLKKLLAR